MQMKHGNEELNRRSTYLRTMRKIWIVPAAAAVGAALFFLVYFLVTVVFGGAREYEYVTKLYVEYAMNEDTQTAYDYYNGWTWNDLIVSNPDISDTIVAQLPEGTDLSTVSDEANVQILSDIRVMTITVTDSDPDRATAIGDAVSAGLVHFGGTAKEFDEIRVMSTTEPAVVTYSNRTKNAILLGFIIGALTGLFAIMISSTLDDAVYVPEDAGRRFGVPCLGATASKGAGLPAKLDAELRADVSRLMNGAYKCAVTYTGKDKETAESVARRLAEACAKDGDAAGTCFDVVPCDNYDALRMAGKIVMVLPYGRKNGTEADRVLEVMRQQGCSADATVIADADVKFLRHYYRMK
jgi:capsular polysaccharide biosynthesis protein